MERFRLRVRNQPKRGHIWELQLFPDRPHRQYREVDSRVLGSCSAPEAIFWLRKVAEPFLLRAEDPNPISGDEFGPKEQPRWLRHEDGMRLALAFSAARWLVTPRQRQKFLAGLKSLPSEVILYWFTLCFYGYQQAAGRAALRTLLTHEEPADASKDYVGEVIEKPFEDKAYSLPEVDPNGRFECAREALAEYTAKIQEQDQDEMIEPAEQKSAIKAGKSKSTPARKQREKSKRQANE